MFARPLSLYEECRVIEAWSDASVKAGFEGRPKPDLLEMRIARSKQAPLSSGPLSSRLDKHPSGLAPE